jgi:hypothetical protein
MPAPILLNWDSDGSKLGETRKLRIWQRAMVADDPKVRAEALERVRGELGEVPEVTYLVEFLERVRLGRYGRQQESTRAC